MVKIHKGIKINSIKIEKGIVHIYSEEGDELKVTRAQRNEIADYQSPEFISRVSKAFNNDKIIADKFTYEVNGKAVNVNR